MKQYGFDDYFGVGDLIGEECGGYNYDDITAESAVTWMRTRAPALKRENKPWFLAVNLVNPHDVMFLDTDPPGSNLQNTPRPLCGNRRPPEDRLYETTWDGVPLAASRRQPYDEPGWPEAYRMYLAASSNTVGAFTSTDERVRICQNYYFNCIRDCDTHVERLLRALNSLNLTEQTIVVLTSDHGDHVGAHQLVGKGE
ncbi:sulfatase-like hydrolase/transferase [Caballeronia sp. LP006]|uniref:sulfatase-like hydrolase/transferase n=1 Tax=Caballeronia sp. LP006 TaxID=3038552 RepID=UPI002863DDD0|nr:sulfatase-like hydrolase/transferase [Caballeronia sp. LP006]MDR5832311.1 sulfatase-like hydrolase/transferase [Caballeronia sp. LP006]